MAGRLRNRVTIQTQATSQDAVGQRTITWTTVETVWANIEPISSRDWFNASGEHAEITHKITLRYGATISVGDRLVEGSRIFDVRHPPRIVDERDRFLEVMVIENAG